VLLIKLLQFNCFKSFKLFLIMGKGDVKTKRGKISKGSFGKTRLRKRLAKAAAASSTPVDQVQPQSKMQKKGAKK
jgi:ribosomal small subunit protein bTHX